MSSHLVVRRLLLGMRWVDLIQQLDSPLHHFVPLQDSHDFSVYASAFPPASARHVVASPCCETHKEAWLVLSLCSE